MSGLSPLFFIGLGLVMIVVLQKNLFFNVADKANNEQTTLDDGTFKTYFTNSVLNYVFYKNCNYFAYSKENLFSFCPPDPITIINNS